MYIQIYLRSPSRHRIEEHDMLNWLKSDRKKMNAGMLKELRLRKLEEQLELCECSCHKNHYA